MKEWTDIYKEELVQYKQKVSDVKEPDKRNEKTLIQFQNLSNGWVSQDVVIVHDDMFDIF